MDESHLYARFFTLFPIRGRRSSTSTISLPLLFLTLLSCVQRKKLKRLSRRSALICALKGFALRFPPFFFGFENCVRPCTDCPDGEIMQSRSRF